MPPGSADRPLGDGATSFLAGLRSGPVGAEATRRATERAGLLLAYLDQEGVTAPGRVGFVDVGWTGRATRALEDLLAAAGRPVPAAHLFVGLLAPPSAPWAPSCSPAAAAGCWTRPAAGTRAAGPGRTR